jgi:hypothetical protein
MVSAPVVGPLPLPARDPAPALFEGRGVGAKESTCSHREAEEEAGLSLKLDSTWRAREEVEAGEEVNSKRSSGKKSKVSEERKR